jgi:hypothetical protein
LPRTIHRTVRDDAGVRVRRRTDPPSRRALERLRPKSVRRAADRKVSLAVWACLVLLGVPTIAAVQLLSWLLEPAMPEALFTPIALGVVAAIFAALIPIALRWLWRGERGWCVVMACCPACDYDMVGLAVREDGLSVCPECGGAWKMGSGAGEG